VRVDRRGPGFTRLGVTVADAGFDRRVFADALSAAAAHSDAAFAELGFGPLRASAAQWRIELLNATDISAPDAVRSTGGLALPGLEAPDYPNSRRPSERHRSPSSNAGRDGPSRSP
jgi:hypothetical protein